MLWYVDSFITFKPNFNGSKWNCKYKHFTTKIDFIFHYPKNKNKNKNNIRVLLFCFFVCVFSFSDSVSVRRKSFRLCMCIMYKTELWMWCVYINRIWPSIAIVVKFKAIHSTFSSSWMHSISIFVLFFISFFRFPYFLLIWMTKERISTRK